MRVYMSNWYPKMPWFILQFTHPASEGPMTSFKKCPEWVTPNSDHGHPIGLQDQSCPPWPRPIFNGWIAACGRSFPVPLCAWHRGRPPWFCRGGARASDTAAELDAGSGGRREVYQCAWAEGVPWESSAKMFEKLMLPRRVPNGLKPCNKVTVCDEMNFFRRISVF